MSSPKNILLVCSSGMSTSLLAKEMRKVAEQEGYPANINFSSTVGLEDLLSQTDVVLMGPQLKYRFREIKEQCQARGVPVQVIPDKVYGFIDGKSAFEMAKKMIEG